VYLRSTSRVCLTLMAGLLIATQVIATQALAQQKKNRPAEWAEPLNVEGVPNLHKLGDGFYRSAQPSAEGMRELKKMGVKSVVNLRLLHSDRDEIHGTSLGYLHLPIRTWKLKEKHVLKFLRWAIDPARKPVLLHCKHGSDRTGTMAAFYRMVVQNWSKEKAILEMKEGGFGYHAVWQNLLIFIQEADISAYRKKLGLDTPQKQ
jgi:protein tyrosine phosphatase (PTP) superfamily phosphohydrolase (DUF442 family)